MRWLYGFLLATLLFLFGIPLLQTLVRRTGYYSELTFDQAILVFILFLAAVAAIGRGDKRPPNSS